MLRRELHLRRPVARAMAGLALGVLAALAITIWTLRGRGGTRFVQLAVAVRTRTVEVPLPIPIMLPVALAATPPPVFPPEPSSDWHGLAVSLNGDTVVVWSDTHAYASRDDGRSFQVLVADAHHIVSAAVGDDGTVYLVDDPQSLGVARVGEPVRWRDVPAPFHLSSLALYEPGYDRLVAFGWSRAKCWQSVALSDDDGETWRTLEAPPDPAAGCRGGGIFPGFAADGDLYLGSESKPPFRWVALNIDNGWYDLPFDALFDGPLDGEVKRDGWLYFASDGRAATDWQHTGASCGKGNRLCAMDPSGMLHALQGVEGSPFQMTVVRNGRAAFLLQGHPHDPDHVEHLFVLRGDDASPIALPPTGPIGGFDGVDAALGLDARGRLTALAGGRVVRWTGADGWRTLAVP